jgi:hypothetical protein
MGKKQVAVSLRKPPPTDPDAFVVGPEASRPASNDTRAFRVADAPTVATRVGERRELTIYLPQELARQLSVRCTELDRDISNLIAEAVSKSLEVDEPVATVTVPEGRWTGVRSLLSELRARLPIAFPTL